MMQMNLFMWQHFFNASSGGCYNTQSTWSTPYYVLCALQPLAAKVLVLGRRLIS
jgi:hypothetical protein